jgi:cytidylate kinase
MAAAGAICISHATGANGPEVGRLVADQLGLRYADDEVIAEAAEWADLDPGLVADAERRKSVVVRILGGFGSQPAPRLTSGDVARALPSDADLRALIKSAVSSLARQGGVVLVAHAASFALEPGDGLRVLVIASRSTRSERLAIERSTTVAEADRMLSDEDAGRADYLKRFYGIDRELPSHYDLVVNTDAISAEDAAAVVIAAGRALSATAT